MGTGGGGGGGPENSPISPTVCSWISGDDVLLWVCCSFLLFAASASNSHRRARIRISVLITPGKSVRVRSDFFPTRQIRLTSYFDSVVVSFTQKPFRKFRTQPTTCWHTGRIQSGFITFSLVLLLPK